MSLENTGNFTYPHKCLISPQIFGKLSLFCLLYLTLIMLINLYRKWNFSVTIHSDTSHYTFTICCAFCGNRFCLFFFTLRVYALLISWFRVYQELPQVTAESPYSECLSQPSALNYPILGLPPCGRIRQRNGSVIQTIPKLILRPFLPLASSSQHLCRIPGKHASLKGP